MEKVDVLRLRPLKALLVAEGVLLGPPVVFVTGN